MKIINKINWLITWLAAGTLKRSLSHRLKNAGQSWLQQVKSNEPKMFNRVDFILEYCTGKNVLHIGFSDHPFTEEKMNEGSLLHQQLKEKTAALYGVDNDAVAIDQYKNKTNDANVFYADVLQGFPDQVTALKPTIILYSEVLEHLSDPYKAIGVLYDSFDNGTQILVTVPNYTALDSFAASLNKTESIHPHHHWYFSPYTLRQLFNEKQFHLEQLHFGMYFKNGKRINSFLQKYPYNGDCIMAVFTIIKI